MDTINTFAASPKSSPSLNDNEHDHHQTVARAPTVFGQTPAKRTPSIARMVDVALGQLVSKDAGRSIGASGKAIKSYIAKTYGIPKTPRLAIRINKHLKRVVQKGTVRQIRGRGANGSFRKVDASSIKKKKLKTIKTTKMRTSVKTKPKTGKKVTTSRNQLKGVREHVLENFVLSLSS